MLKKRKKSLRIQHSRVERVIIQREQEIEELQSKLT